MWASGPLPNLFWPSGPFLGLLWASGPLPSLFWPRGLFCAFCGLRASLSRGLFWNFCGLLSLFLAFSGPFGPFFSLFSPSGPFLGLLWASGPLLSLFWPRGLSGHFGHFFSFFWPRSLFWAFCGLLGLFPIFSGLGPFLGFAFSGPGVRSWSFLFFSFFFQFFLGQASSRSSFSGPLLWSLI